MVLLFCLEKKKQQVGILTKSNKTYSQNILFKRVTYGLGSKHHIIHEWCVLIEQNLILVLEEGRL